MGKGPLNQGRVEVVNKSANAGLPDLQPTKMRRANQVHVDLGPRGYIISIYETGMLEQLGTLLQALSLGEQAAIITSPVVRQLYGSRLESSLKEAGFPYIIVEIPDGEENKSFERYGEAVGQLVSFNNEWRTFVVCVGGGVVGDLGGFIAATFKRGVRYVQVPTTLLAQVDCAIGGKVGVDHPKLKNSIGTFYQPKAVFEDLSLLRTLPKREICSGLAEIIKYGIICDPNLFEYVEDHLEGILSLDSQVLRHVVERSCEIKAGIVERDETDTQAIRAKLNLGHTIGHALEVATDYRVYRHGEAVSVGIVCASEIANVLQICDRESMQRIEKLLLAAGLPVKAFGGSVAEVMQALRRDKKNGGGKNRFVLPLRIGDVKIEEGVPEALIEDVLQKRMPSLAH